MYRSPVEAEIVGFGRGAAVLESTRIFSVSVVLGCKFMPTPRRQTRSGMGHVFGSSCLFVLRVFQHIYSRGSVAVGRAQQ